MRAITPARPETPRYSVHWSRHDQHVGEVVACGVLPMGNAWTKSRLRSAIVEVWTCLEALTVALGEAVELNRQAAHAAAGEDYTMEKIVVAT